MSKVVGTRVDLRLDQMAEGRPAAIGDAFAGLTSAQQTCLRLVAQGLTSQEIADQTGLPYRKVEQHISTARALLGSVNRREAARLFMAWKRLNSPETESRGLAGAEHAVIVGQAARPGTTNARTWATRLRGKTNDLTSLQRVYAILRIAAFSAITLSTIAVATTGIRSL